MRSAAWALLLFSLMVILPVNATRLPGDLKSAVADQFPNSHIRLDGSIQTDQGDLFLPMMPSSNEKKKGKAHIELTYPDDTKSNANAFVFSNGWCFLRVFRVGAIQTIVRPNELPENLRKQIMACKFPSDLIVPDQFVLSPSFKSCAGDVTVSYEKDTNKHEVISPKKIFVSKPSSTSHGAIFLTSLSSGSITMIDDKTLNKIIAFPTEGTPCSMVWADGKLYIADEAKDRVLLLDPNGRQFLGQIDLLPHSAPKGIAILPNGSLLYVSESITNDVAVIETSTQKVLMRTKVLSGPGKLAITPNGNCLVVLNVPSAKATIISTANQKVIAVVPVGAMPTAVAIATNSEEAYVSNRMANSVSIIDLNQHQVVGTIATGLGPTGLALSPDDQKLYVVQARENSIAVYDTKTRQKLQELKIPTEIDFPGSIRVMPDGKQLLVTSEASDTIGMLDLDKFQFDKQISIGSTSHESIWVPVN